MRDVRSKLHGQVRRFGQSFERCPRELKHGPIIERSGPQLSIELNCGIIPIEHRPGESRASTLFSEASQIRENCGSDSAAPVGRLNEKIFQVDARTTDEG